MLIEAVSEATHMGKSTIVQRVRDYLDDIGVANVMVRVESRRLAGALRDGDVSIATEDLAQVETTPGGIVGIVKPGLQELNRIALEGGVVLWDWPGGFGQQRQEILLRANLDAILQKKGINALTLVMTTNVPERIAEAQRLLEVTDKIAPSFKRILVQNEYVGRFEFARDSAPWRSLMASEAASTSRALTLSKIADVSLATLKPTGLSVRQIIDQDPEVLGELLGKDEFTMAACVTAVAAWYDRSGQELGKILPFRAPPKSIDASFEAAGRETEAT
ncbi:hypothetical protein BIWAKO_02868 [Bosea sp. BIWAKO-01]|nr:hypothetical protein BIWAKO_02868 [Bosea sp. BIWAKO-01]